MINNDFLNKDTYMVQEQAHLNILEIISDVCMANKDKDTNQTTHIDRSIHFVINDEE